MRIHFTIPGAPVPKARARGKNFYTPKKTRDYETRVAYYARMEWGRRPPLDGAIEVICHFYLPIPKSWSKKKKAMALSGELKPITTPDADNLEKSIWDACQAPTEGDIKRGILKAGIYKNDSQITDWEGKKRYSDNPRVEVWIESEGEEEPIISKEENIWFVTDFNEEEKSE